MYENAELGRTLAAAVKKDYDRALPKLIARVFQSEFALWTLGAGNDKKFARIQILKTLNAQWERAL